MLLWDGHLTMVMSIGAASSSEDVLDGLENGNKQYEDKFGFIFLICATGKSGEEMLASLLSRFQNPPKDEVRVSFMSNSWGSTNIYEQIVIAAGEQAKITRLRILKFIDEQRPLSSKL